MLLIYQAKHSMEDCEARERDSEIHGEGGHEGKRGSEGIHVEHDEQNEQNERGHRPIISR